MLPKHKRLTKKEFNEVFEKGQPIHSDFLFGKVLKTKKPTDSKFSVSVPVKVEKKAVKRNLLRRRGYVILKNTLENIKNDFKIIIILKKGAEKLDFEEYKREINKFLKKSKLLKSHL